jgi:hypothetical protein
MTPRLSYARKFRHPVSACCAVRNQGGTSPSSSFIPVSSQPTRSLSSVTTQRVALNCAMPMQHQAYDGFLPVDSHLKSERELDAGPLLPSPGSPRRTPNCPKLAAEKTKSRPRSPGNTLRPQPALSGTQAITSATNRSLADRPREGVLQRTHPTITLEVCANFLAIKGTNLMEKIEFVKKDQVCGLR